MVALPLASSGCERTNISYATYAVITAEDIATPVGDIITFEIADSDEKVILDTYMIISIPFAFLTFKEQNVMKAC